MLLRKVNHKFKNIIEIKGYIRKDIFILIIKLDIDYEFSKIRLRLLTNYGINYRFGYWWRVCLSKRLAPIII
ncbi:hypothetical protein H1P_330013 [Hyella patelloides LEGE 07179]|uniref:Uncharacterized protein n=1 Tax=Hyella patelloides LEGE 07179 TaxID=945734 RepID=A0A563VV65_9CYAN|nr:hypothetical protein H1P_330013 [Hyella patelloides LEGE 07179]